MEEAVGRVTGVRAGTERLVVLAESRTAQDGNEAIRAEVEQLAIELTGPLWGLWVWMVFGLLAPVFWVAIALAPTLAAGRLARIGSRLALTATGIQPRAIGCATRTFRFCCQTGIACSPAGRDTVETPRRSFR